MTPKPLTERQRQLIQNYSYCQRQKVVSNPMSVSVSRMMW